MKAVRGCLIAGVLAVALGVFCFQTELGWTYFYSFGHFGPDMRQVAADHGLQPRSMTARMFVGNRAGYAWVEADDAALEAFSQALVAKGCTVFPDPDLPAEERQFSASLPELPASERTRYEQALVAGKARAVRGREVRNGPLKGFLFIYIPGENRGLLASGYPYG